MFYVYIIESEKKEIFYIGHSDNLERRIEYHNAGKSKFTSKYIPWKMVYFEEYSTRKDAFNREQFFKKQRNKAFYKRLINEFNTVR